VSGSEEMMGMHRVDKWLFCAEIDPEMSNEFLVQDRLVRGWMGIFGTLVPQRKKV